MKSTPCGVWRLPRAPTDNVECDNVDDGYDDDDDDDDDASARDVDDRVYDELWTNAVAHCYEYHDHTFHEHFDGESPTIFFPLRDVNEYLVKRVTKNRADFFDDYFVFDTRVEYVRETTDGASGSDGTWDGGRRGGFLVTLHHLPSGRKYDRVFDRCVWAAGENRVGSIPKSLRDVFIDGGAVFGGGWKCEHVGGGGIEGEKHIEKEMGRTEDDSIVFVFHSAETHSIRTHCPNRNVLIIGGESSAEDMALQCLKWNASHVDVATRQDDWCLINSTTQWPGDRVRVHLEVEVCSVEYGNVALRHVMTKWPCGYVPSSNDEGNGQYDNDGRAVILKDIRTVILCTGYDANLNMLDPRLRPECEMIPKYNMGDHHPSIFVSDINWSKWKMKNGDNAAHEYTGDVDGGRKRMIRKNYNHPDMHRGILFKNPNMMYLCEHGSDIPLLSLDVHAWLLCSYLTRRVPMPTVDELRTANIQQYMDQMHLPTIRYDCDEAYHEILYSKVEYWGELEESSSSEDDNLDSDDNHDEDEEEEEEEEEDSPADLDEIEYEKYQLRLLCRVMEEGGYPGLCIGNYESLNEYGNRLIKYSFLSDETRHCLKADHPEDSEWRTFRDADEQAKSVASLYTGTKARPLNKRWMDINDGRRTTIRNGGV
ncbi:hypothetical protein ACHAXA_000433 [Cyclostephanos tholiformis]|uniref:Uncharacterized protein n=1 Tax=Cyclostephanos tholiformis TaxID=382380 RepID=A0ABD3RVY2_9STRA